jgi:hypothetical protein
MTGVGESIPRSCEHRLQRHRDGSNAARVLRGHNGLERRTPEAELLDRSARRRPSFGERVAHRIVRADPSDDPVTLEPAQPVGQQVLRDAGQPFLQLVEARRAAEELSEDQNRPAITDDVERGRHRTELPIALAVLGPWRCHIQNRKVYILNFQVAILNQLG